MASSPAGPFHASSAIADIAPGQGRNDRGPQAPTPRTARPTRCLRISCYGAKRKSWAYSSSEWRRSLASRPKLWRPPRPISKPGSIAPPVDSTASRGCAQADVARHVPGHGSGPKSSCRARRCRPADERRRPQASASPQAQQPLMTAVSSKPPVNALGDHHLFVGGNDQDFDPSAHVDLARSS